MYQVIIIFLKLTIVVNIIDSKVKYPMYIQGMRLTDLQSVVSFMYQGEVNIDRQQLSSFLAVAEDLQVKGGHRVISKVGTLLAQ
jgi:hypothetical protein